MGPSIAKVGPDLVVRSIDHPYMQELADRFSAMTEEGLEKIMESLPERARAIVKALSGENQQLKQALQESQIEHKYGLAKEQIRAATTTHDTVTKAHTTLATAQIHAGAQLLNSAAESGKHPREANIVIEEAARAASIDNGEQTL